MSDREAARMRIVQALLPRRNRGRPKKGRLQDVDTIRAALVVIVFIKNPGRFKTRREAIRYLQAMSKAAPLISGHADELALSREDAKDLESFSRLFPMRELEQSISRGMNKNNKSLGRIEKLAKKSR